MILFHSINQKKILKITAYINFNKNNKNNNKLVITLDESNTSLKIKQVFILSYLRYKINKINFTNKNFINFN